MDVDEDADVDVVGVDVVGVDVVVGGLYRGTFGGTYVFDIFIDESTVGELSYIGVTVPLELIVIPVCRFELNANKISIISIIQTAMRIRIFIYIKNILFKYKK